MRGSLGSTDAAALTGVLTDAPADTEDRAAVHADFDEHLDVDDVVITAVEVGTVTG